MKIFLDFIVDASLQDGNNLGNEFVNLLQKNPSAEALKEWFYKNKYDVKIDDCSKLIMAKDGLTHIGKIAQVKDGY